MGHVSLKPTTIRTRAHQLHKAESALIYSGRRADSLCSLADLVTIASFKAAIGHLLDQQGGETSEALHGLASALLAVARHHVHVEDEVERRLAGMVANLDPGVSGFALARAIGWNFSRIPQVHAALLHLPERLLKEAKRARSNRKRSLMAQLAIVTEVLLFAPLRLANLCMLQVGETFRPVQVNGERRWVIDLPAEMVKNRMRRNLEIPTESSRFIDEALRLYEQREGWIFPGRNGGSKSSGTLGVQIKRAVESRVGVNTHLYRAIAGCTHLKENPGFESARALMGDRDDRVLRENYLFLSERHLIRHTQESNPPASRKGSP